MLNEITTLFEIIIVAFLFMDGWGSQGDTITMADVKMTVHEWVLSFRLGEERDLPENCSYISIKDYAKSRFNRRMIKTINGKIKRVN